MILYTTLALLRQHNACADRYAHLKRALGKYGDDKPIRPLPAWCWCSLMGPGLLCSTEY